ncbi:MAG: hypothetical protein QXO74_05490 [Candidatus Methanomethylicia archaeon]
METSNLDLSFDYAGLLAFVIVIMYIAIYMIHEERLDIKVTKDVKENLFPRLTSNLMKINSLLKDFEDSNIPPPPLTSILHDGLSIYLISELNLRIPKFANIFRNYIDLLKQFDSMLESEEVSKGVLRDFAKKIVNEGNILFSEISRINSMKKLPARQGAFSSLRR